MAALLVCHDTAKRSREGLRRLVCCKVFVELIGLSSIKSENAAAKDTYEVVKELQGVLLLPNIDRLSPESE
jgi:hypothetical protein